MSNRASRRADVARFRGEALHGLVTHLIDAADTASLARAPLLRDAVSYFRKTVSQRRPVCCACKRSLVDVRAGAFLLSTPVSTPPKSCSVTALCAECWRDLSNDEVEAVALRVLRKVVPRGRFEDAAS